MAARGRLWGAERIRGELLKLGIKVSKRTIQKYMRGVRSRGAPSSRSSCSVDASASARGRRGPA
jgi:putative transposase